jgi:hypothetical protein
MFASELSFGYLLIVTMKTTHLFLEYHRVHISITPHANITYSLYSLGFQAFHFSPAPSL